MAKWQCPSCGVVVTGTKKALRYAKKASCKEKHQVKIVQAKTI